MAVHGQQNGFLQRLGFVRVTDCGDVRAPFPAKLLRALNNLRLQLSISTCKSLEEVFELGEPDEGSSEEKELPLLSSLTELRLSCLPELKCIWKGPSRHVSLQSLNRLNLESLNKLTFIFTPSLARSLPKLESLSISKCGQLQHIIREEAGEREIIPESPGEKDDAREITTGSLCFPKLRSLSISYCGKLKYVFPVSVSPSLLNLEEMEIDFADNVKHIFYTGEGDALTRDGIIKFPKLRGLSLSNCSFFGPKNFAAQLPSLQILNIDGHKELGNLFAQLQGLTNLEKLCLESLPDMRCIWKGLVLSKLTTLEIFEQLFLHKLESVEVGDCGDVFTLFPARLRQGLKNLKEVIVHSCKSLEEVFELGEADDGSSEEKELLSSLTKLELRRLPEVKCIWKGPTRHVSLQNLVHLSVWLLNKLTFIFTASLAQSLPQLQTLEIRDCGELMHIIREEDGEREIIPESPCFPKLKKIFIEDCGKLEYVSLSHNRDGIIKFPQLRELSLELRSNYSFLGPRNFDAQLPLQRLTIKGHEEVGNWLAQLQMAVHVQQNGFLQRLESVHVDDCGDVRTPFPAKLLRALKNLKEVIVWGCKSLEEVFELGEPYEGSSEEKELPLPSSLTRLLLFQLPELKCIWKGPTSHVSLQSLADLHLDSLDKLTFIFTPSLVQSLPQLERLYISECDELKHIIREEDGEREIIQESPESPGQDDQASPINVEKEIVLPNLKELSIQQLSSIVCFSFGWCDYFLFPRLEKLKVHQCPKLTTKFATTPDGSMSAHSEVPEVAEDSSINREWTRNMGWKEDGDSCL
ncbi:hypothetical protein Peur_037467 [Populus x canadensis]